jgi:hypothetical protein
MGCKGSEVQILSPRPIFTQQHVHPYSETIIRHRAIDAEGKPREILERVTYERQAGADPAELKVIHRRYDLRTGEVLNRLSETEFEEEGSGARLRLQP